MSLDFAVHPVQWAITTSKARGKHGLGLSDAAKLLAEHLSISILSRDNKGVDKLMTQHMLEVLLIEEENALTAHWADGQTLVYHPGMAVPRIRHIKDGASELLIEVLGIASGDAVLDCTMGMASDTVTISYALGADGTITALESSPVIYAVTAYGLQHWNWQNESKTMRQAMERIVPIYTSYDVYLHQLHEAANIAQDKQYDVIYFDPMFERPIAESSGIAPLRRVADYMPLTQDTLELARGLCRKRVVVKHREGTLKHLHFDEILGGKYSNLAYGICYAGKDTEGM